MPPDRVVAETTEAIAFFDEFPVSDGHTLVVPRRHVNSIYELAPAEQDAVWAMVGTVRTTLIVRYGVESFNVGVNDGLAAGQTVPHAHVHVIPRRAGEVAPSARWGPLGCPWTT